MQLFSIFQFISWSQFCEWLDLKIVLGHHVDTNLKPFRNNSILVESWLTFGPQLLMRLQKLRYCYTIKFSQKGQFPLSKPYVGHIFPKLSATFQSISFGQFRRDPKHELKFRLKVIQWESTLSFNATESIFHMVDIDHDLLIR